MQFSPEQDKALLAVSKWLKDPNSPQVFRLFGYAGTGKTTLAKYLAEGVDGNVLFGAYTGKAAYVLRQKGCPNATTLHSMIYHTKDKGRARLKELEAQLAELRHELRQEFSPEHDNTSPTDMAELARRVNEHKRVKDLEKLVNEERTSLARPMFTLNPESVVKDAAAVFVDEVSMVDGRMGEDLLSFGTKLLVLGDPAQLPPVMGGGFFTEDCKPDIMLEDVHRNSGDIIRMATRVRRGESLPLGMYGPNRVTTDRPSPEEAMAADQILVGRNKTRHAANARARQLLGRQEWHPIAGDRLVCLRNNHDKGLLNGAIWNCLDVGQVDKDRVVMTVGPEDGDGSPVLLEAHAAYFRGEELPFWERKEAEEFDYGYALTVHKAQGSEWDNVLLFDEAWCFRDDRQRWLYTALTRAGKMVTVVRD